jgi:hypothetical protein
MMTSQDLDLPLSGSIILGQQRATPNIHRQLNRWMSASAPSRCKPSPASKGDPKDPSLRESGNRP